jgi:hypothetical protein
VKIVIGVRRYYFDWRSYISQQDGVRLEIASHPYGSRVKIARILAEIYQQANIVREPSSI